MIDNHALTQSNAPLAVTFWPLYCKKKKKCIRAGKKIKHCSELNILEHHFPSATIVSAKKKEEKYDLFP